MRKGRADGGTRISGGRKQDVRTGCPGSPARLSLIRQLSDDRATFEHLLAVRSLYQAARQVRFLRGSRPDPYPGHISTPINTPNSQEFPTNKKAAGTKRPGGRCHA